MVSVLDDCVLIDCYVVGRGFMVGFLCVLCDEGVMTTRALFERASAFGVGM